MKNIIYLFLSILIFASCSNKCKNIDTDEACAWNTRGKVEKSKDKIILTGKDARAITTSAYKDFILELECKTSEGAIGGISFHTDGLEQSIDGYEVLINNNEEPSEWRKTGSLSTIRNFGKCVAYNDTWVPVKIEVRGHQIKVFVDDILITDYTQPESPFRIPEYSKRILSSGVFVFSNYSDPSIEFRDIKVTPIYDVISDASAAIDEQNDDIIRLQQQNFPTIDMHLHLKGGWTGEEAAANSRKYGITYGIAPNCGKNFPITTDEEIYHWLDSMKQQPFLMPMQAEGREWLDMFSREAISRFDYVFTDAMTWTDHKGRRMRIWIPEETFIDDKQQFMDTLVEKACGIISTEPINIYVNPTFIPDILMPEYNSLWTEFRMEKIIDACINSGVAIEINNRYKIPSAKFIKMAKAKGAKFTSGTNNAGIEDVGKMEYFVEMIKKCDLTKDDIFIPTSKNR